MGKCVSEYSAFARPYVGRRRFMARLKMDAAPADDDNEPVWYVELPLPQTLVTHDPHEAAIMKLEGLDVQPQ
jgi:hypothetical protein